MLRRTINQELYGNNAGRFVPQDRWYTPTSAITGRFEVSAKDWYIIPIQSEVFGYFRERSMLPITCQFGQASNYYLCSVTRENGEVVVFDTRPNGQNSIVKRWEAHENAVFDYAWTDGDRKCLTASGDAKIILWDFETTTPVGTFREHSRTVRTIAPSPVQPAQFASGGRDGMICLWDTRVNIRYPSCNNAEKRIRYAHRYSPPEDAVLSKGRHRDDQTITSVLYLNENLVLSSGAGDGDVKCWDIRKWYQPGPRRMPKPAFKLDCPDKEVRRRGIVTMCMDPHRQQVFTTHANGRVYGYDLGFSYEKARPREFAGGGCNHQTFYNRMAVSPDGKYLLSGSSAKCGMIWEIDKPYKTPLYLLGHGDMVTAADWCPKDFCTLATLSDDCTLFVWRPGPISDDGQNHSVVGYAYVHSKDHQDAQTVRKCSGRIDSSDVPFTLPYKDETAQTRAITPASPGKSEQTVRKALQPTDENCQASPKRTLPSRAASASPGKRGYHSYALRCIFCEGCSAKISPPRKKRPFQKNDNDDSSQDCEAVVSSLKSGTSSTEIHGKDVKSFSKPWYSSPTANLPIRSFECWEGNSASLSRDEKKLDWLTKFRLSKETTDQTTNVASKISPETKKEVPATTSGHGSDKQMSLDKDKPSGSIDTSSVDSSSKHTDATSENTSPKETGSVTDQESPQGRPSKRIKREKSASDTPTRTSNHSLRRSQRIRHHKKSESRKESMSILRYFKKN